MPERRVTYQISQKGHATGLAVEAPSWARLFTEAALAVHDYRISQDLIRDTDKIAVKVQAPTLEKLFRAWLEQMVALFNEKKFLAVRVVCTRFDSTCVEATLCGETYEATRHGYARPFEKLSETEAMVLGESEQGHGFRVLFYVI